MNKWTIGTIIGSALLAVSKKSSGSNSRRVQVPNKGICEMDEVILTELREDKTSYIVYLQDLLEKENVQSLEEFRSRMFGEMGDIDFSFPKSMIASFKLLSFDPGLNAEREMVKLLREIVPKTWDQDKHNVRFFVQDQTAIEQYYDDEAEDYLEEEVFHGHFYDRLDDYDFDWDQNIPEGTGGNQTRAYEQSGEWDDTIDGREMVLDEILESTWTRDPELRDRIIKLLYSLVIVHTLKSIKKGDTNWISRNAGYTGEYMNNTYPDTKITSNGFSKNLRGWDSEEPRVDIGSFGALGLPTEKFYESINYFASMRNDKLLEMILSSEMTTNAWDDGVTREFTITLRDLFHTVSFTARLNLGSLSALAFSGNLDVSGYIKTETRYRTNWVGLFAYVKNIEEYSSGNHFIDVINKTPQWFQDWYKSRNRKKDKTKLRKR